MQRAKKADLSINIIIITIIALVVLIILTFVFTGRLTIFNKNLSQCEKLEGATCNIGNECDPGFIKDPTRVCLDSNNQVDENRACCVKFQDFTN